VWLPEYGIVDLIVKPDEESPEPEILFDTAVQVRLIPEMVPVILGEFGPGLIINHAVQPVFRQQTGKGLKRRNSDNGDENQAEGDIVFFYRHLRT